LRQMAPACAGAHNLSAGRNLETLGHGLSGFNAFGSSHKILIAKEHRLYVLLVVVASDF